jgi:hypothetical protein
MTSVADPAAVAMPAEHDARRGCTMRPSVWAYLGLAIFVTGLWWNEAARIDAAYAWQGYSPVHFANRFLRPQDYRADYPQGVELYRSSLPMMVYPWLAGRCGVPPATTLKGFILVELAWLAWAMVFLTQSVRPGAPPVVAVLAAVVYLASNFAAMDLARFGTTGVDGLYYKLADGFRLLAVALVFRRRFLAAWLLLAAGYACHPLMAGFGVLFTLGCVAATPGEWKRASFLAGAAVAAVGVGLWTAHVGTLVQPAGGAESVEMWFKTAQLTSHHWFPFRNGVFTTFHHRHILPVLSFLMLATYYAVRHRQPGEPALKAVASGMAALWLAVVFGLAFSVQEISPSLVKICLHRASLLAITLALPYVVAGLWQDMARGPWWQRLSAAVVLLSPATGRAGYPIAWCSLLVWPGLRDDCRRFARWIARRGAAAGDRFGGGTTGEQSPGTSAPGRAALLAMAGGCAAAVLAYLATGRLDSRTCAGYFGWGPTLAAAALLGGTLALLPALGRRFAVPAKAFSAFALILLALAVTLWTAGSPLPRALEPQCRDYLDAQLWARANTPPNTLFLVDPTIYYGWRDYSERCSFGNLREWLYSWHYAMDYPKFREGVKRLAAFGIRLDDFLPARPGPADLDRCDAALRDAYYQSDPAWFAEMARRYGVQYFVMRKEPLGRVRSEELARRLGVAYENRHFLVLASPAAMVARR